jgi:hypothetical protein
MPLDRYFDRKRRRIALTLFVAAVVLSACARQPESFAFGAPGFWSGLLHGFTIFFSLVGSFFTDYRIYAFPNTGGWYDLGYFLGACAFIGGCAAS